MMLFSSEFVIAGFFRMLALLFSLLFRAGDFSSEEDKDRDRFF